MGSPGRKSIDLDRQRELSKTGASRNAPAPATRRNHSSIKTTPAVKAGIVSEKWSLETLLAIAAA